jgi:hypothetical protein
MSLENPTIVQATSNTVTVVLNPTLNQIAVVQPQTGSTVVLLVLSVHLVLVPMMLTLKPMQRLMLQTQN